MTHTHRERERARAHTMSIEAERTDVGRRNITKSQFCYSFPVDDIVVSQHVEDLQHINHEYES